MIFIINDSKLKKCASCIEWQFNFQNPLDFKYPLLISQCLTKSVCDVYLRNIDSILYFIADNSRSYNHFVNTLLSDKKRGNNIYLTYTEHYKSYKSIKCRLANLLSNPNIYCDDDELIEWCSEETTDKTLYEEGDIDLMSNMYMQWFNKLNGEDTCNNYNKLSFFNIAHRISEYEQDDEY